MITETLDPSAIAALDPGSHVILFSEDPVASIAGRRLGLEVRDTILVLSPNKTRFAFLFRKPCSESTIAAQVLKTGTGALWINGCRVGSEVRTNQPAGNKAGGASLMMSVHGMPGNAGSTTAEGRWPPNLLFVHGPECRNAGQRFIKSTSTSISGLTPRAKDTSTYGQYRRVPFGGHADSNGFETITTWECEPDCPVRALEEQTQRLHDAGNSHFFPQFANDDELHGWLNTLIGSPK